MKTNRDLAFIIMFAVLNFVFLALIAQVPLLITGIPGIGYAFSIFYTITFTVALLFYEGKRWRFFSQGILFALLTLVLGGTPDILLAKIPLILNIFILDVVFNSLYGFFKRKNNLVWWAILGQVYFWTTEPFWILLFYSLFSFIEGVSTAWFIPVMSLMLPVMIIEAIAGGYLGYKIYRRVEKLP